MTPESPPSRHVSASMSPKSLSDVPPTKDKVDLDNFGRQWKERIRDFSELEILVMNPPTKDLEKLPPLPHWWNPFVMHVYVDHSSKLYGVLAAGSFASGEDSSSKITELYDSWSGQWERVGDLPGPAFALNEHRSAVLRNGNIFCIGVVELGDQTVNAILGYNVEEGIWSKKLPLKSHGDLFSVSELDNVPVFERWVDRTEWIQSEGDEEEKIETLTMPVNVWKKVKSDCRRSKENPEYGTPPLGNVFDIEGLEKWDVSWALGEGFRVLAEIPRTNSLDPSGCIDDMVLHDTTRARISSAPSSKRFQRSNPGRSSGCSGFLAVQGLLNLPRVIGATPASAPWSSPSAPQVSASSPTFFYVGVGATIVGTAIGLIAVGFKLCRHYNRRESEDSLRAAIETLSSRLFQGGTRDPRIGAGELKLREATPDVVVLEAFPIPLPDHLPTEPSPRTSLRTSTKSSNRTFLQSQGV